MEDYKSENLKKVFPNIKLDFEVCDDEQAEILFQQILQSHDLTIEDLAERNSEKLMFVCNVNDENHLVSKCLQTDSFFYNNQIIIMNLNYDSCFRMGYQDIVKYFEYIWYPVSDDLLIFDDQYHGVYYVDHDGSLYRLMIENITKIQ